MVVAVVMEFVVGISDGVGICKGALVLQSAT
jgi:hypothetical protein